jgi:branched-chain amino acid aminotransferase
MDELIAYHNGDWKPHSQVLISPYDRGFTMGDVVFDVERTFDGKIFRLREHIDRLYRSLQYYRIDCGLSMDEMMSISEEVVKRNEHLRPSGQDFMVRQVVTRGQPPGSVQGNPTDAMTPTVIVTADYQSMAAFAKAYESGTPVVFPSIRSYTSNSMDPKAKHYSRGNFVQAQLQAADIDPDAMVVLLDQNGNVSEGVSNNFFIVTDGVIRTPKDTSVLQGISRNTVFNLAEQLNIPIVEEDIQPYDAYTANEAFLTNTNFQLLPISTVDKRPVKDGAPGPISKQLLAAWSELVGVDIVGQALQEARGS